MVDDRAGALVRRALVTLVRGTAAGGAAERVAATHGPELLALARAHRVSPWLGGRALGGDADPVLLAGLAEDRAAAAAGHLLAARTVASLAEDLAVPHAVVKGPVLSGHWYGDAGARAYSDVDVLVGPGTFRVAFDRLRARGWSELADNYAGFLANDVAEVPLERGPVTLDLHWHLVGAGPARARLRLATAPQLARARTVAVGGAQVATLDPVDTLRHLCVHAGLAGARRLQHLLDVDVVVRTGTVAWHEFVARAAEGRCRALCLAVLGRAARTLGTPVPSVVLEALTPWRGSARLLAVLDGVGGDGVTGTGIGVEGMADSPSVAAWATACRVGAALARAARGAGPTGAGGPLAWRARPGTADEGDREAYLRWVDGQVS